MILYDRIDFARIRDSGDDEAIRILSHPAVFEITNVADLAGRVDGLERVSRNDEDALVVDPVFDAFPNVAPPYPAYWMETRVRPARRVGREFPERIGAYCATVDPDPDAVTASGMTARRDRVRVVKRADDAPRRRVCPARRFVDVTLTEAVA